MWWLQVVSVIFVQCCILKNVWGEKYYGKFVGKLDTKAHDVKGSVYAANKDTFFIKGFSYDGEGPDAFFWAGSTTSPSEDGFIVPDEKGTENVLRRYSNKDIWIKLPNGRTIKDVNWLSVWCREFKVNFGSLQIPDNLELPGPKVIEPLQTFAHGVKSDPIVIKDEKTIYIPKLQYDGAGPDVYFLVGKGIKPQIQGATKVPDEKGSTDVLHGYQGQDITLTLPAKLTVHDIDWFSLYCIQYQENFGHVVIPKDLNVPAQIG
ncbi:protein Skeletor, isoforms B/C-like [Limulus polyphemus]|uniref:Protein Skeletor, isoforms B/C-like n=1 Tax=Limulus polyphemus TaxID=6850 RepID=A0ABM1BC16_LIMPO|nr:protein Skeletor, isoforms B/C-like [Limulus polyphemus]